MTNVFDRLVNVGEEPSHAISSPPQTPDIQPAEETAATPLDVKEVTQELLKHGHLEEARKPALFQRAVVREREISAALEPLDLGLRLDTHRGVAFLVVAETEDDNSDEGIAWKHPLVRRQRLTLEQSLLVTVLRQAFMMHEQETGIGHQPAMIAVDDLLPQDSGSDAKNESRLAILLDQLKTYGIVSEIDKNQEVTIRPMIAHLANPESLRALLQVLKEQVHTRDSEEAPN